VAVNGKSLPCLNAEAVEKEEDTRLRILRFMIHNGGRASPTEIKNGLKLRDLPSVRYHTRSLIHDGMIYEEESDNRSKLYCVQPFLFDSAIDQYLPFFQKFLEISLGEAILCEAVGLEVGDCASCTPEITYDALCRTVHNLIQYLVRFRKDMFEPTNGNIKLDNS